jgi:hypothetical protein
MKEPPIRSASTQLLDLVAARMLNEVLYCEWLRCLEWGQPHQSPRTYSRLATGIRGAGAATEPVWMRPWSSPRRENRPGHRYSGLAGTMVGWILGWAPYRGQRVG